MGIDIKGPEPDPTSWAQCSCGKYRVTGDNLEELAEQVQQHFLDNLDTHATGKTMGGYFLHIPPKPKWWKRIFGKHEGRDL